MASGLRSTTQHAAEIQHVVNVVLADEEHVEECLKSLNISKVSQIVNLTKTKLLKATYDVNGKATPAPAETTDAIWAFKRYVAYQDSLHDPDEQIRNNFIKTDYGSYKWYTSVIHDFDTGEPKPKEVDYFRKENKSTYEKKQQLLLQQQTGATTGTTNPATAVATSPVLPKRSAVDDFKRGIKRDATAYPKLMEFERYFGWVRRFTKVAKAQGVETVLDPDYDPLPGSEEAQLFEAQKNFLDAVLPEVLLCAEARQILDAQRDNSDPQKALAELKNAACNSTASILRMSAILYDLKMCDWKTTKVKDGARGYVVHVNDLLELHNDIAHTEEAQLSDFTMKQRLREAMVNNEKLNNVAELESHVTAEDSSKVYSYNKYYRLLLEAADRYDAQEKSSHSTKGSHPQRKVYAHEIDFENMSVQDFAVYKSARMNADGKVRMDFASWRSLSDEDKETWDKLSEAGKTTILRFVSSDDAKPATMRPNQGRKTRPTRRVNLTDVDIESLTVGELFACMHSVEASGGTTEADSDEDNTVARQVNSASTSLAEPVDYKAYLTKKIDTSSLPQSDIRRMMSTSNTPTTALSKDESNDIKIINGKKYRLCNVTAVTHRQKRYFSVSMRARSRGKHGSMLDRGANAFMAGDNVKTISIIPNVRADVTGLANHQVMDLAIGSIGYYAESNRGPVICIVHQATLHGIGLSITSAGQLEAFGVTVDDKSMHVGGGQKIITPDGYIFPVDIINGLPYTPMRPYTDTEWNELPHVVLTSEQWDPRCLDCIISDKDNWYDAISNPGADPRTSLFDMDGNYKLRTNKSARGDPYELYDDTFFDAIDGTESASLSYMHDVADQCATVHTYRLHFLDALSYFPNDDDDDVLSDPLRYDVFPVNTRSQTRNAQPIDAEDSTTPSTVPAQRITSSTPREMTIQPKDYSVLRPFFAWLPFETVKRTFEVTTQHARLPASTLLKKRFKSSFPAFNIRRRHEDVATDFVYSDTPAVGTGDTIAAIFVGRTTKVTDAYGIKTEKHFPATLEDNVRQRGAMDKLISDRAKSTYSRRALDFLRYFGISQWQSEPYHQNQNFAEDRIDDIKRDTNVLMDRTGTPADLWLLCILFVCFLLNNVAHPSLKWNTPLFTLTGQRNDISMLLCFIWYQPVYYKVYEKSFPSESTEARGRFVGISEHVGHRMTFKILTDDTREIIYRSEVRSALDHLDTNLRVDTIFDGEVSTEFVKRLNEAAQKTILQELEQNGEHVEASVTKHVEASVTTPAPGDGEQFPPPKDGEHTNSLDVKDSSTPQFLPSDLLGRTFLMDKGEDGQRHRAKIKEIVETVKAVESYESKLLKDPTNVKFRVSINNDKYEEILSFDEVLDYIERKENNDSDSDWKYRKIVAHQGPLRQTDPNYLGSQWNVMLELENGEIVEQPLSIAAAEDPVVCALYASKNDLLDTPGWQRFKKRAGRHKKMLREVRQAKLRSYRTAPKYMYGFEVPKNYEHAVKLDQQNGNTKWQDATALEMESLHEYNTFKDFGHKDKPGVAPPEGYKKIRVHLVFAVKHDGRHKARLVADGHLTDIPIESVYSGVVSLRGLRLVLFLAELNGLESWTTDVGNAYLEAETREKVYVVAGPEFGKLEGHILVIHKALYGLRSSGKRWGERLADCLRSMGFKPCKAEPDIWLRRKGDVYEYIATYVDDLEMASEDPQSIIFELEITHGFKLKGTGPIEFHLGCDFGRDDDGTLFMEPKKYIEKMVESYERLFGSRMISNPLSPLEKGDHPELDTSDFLDDSGTQIYQSLIGSMQWAVSLTRFDIATAVMTLSSFRVAPRVGHLERAKRVYCYLAKFPHARLRFRTQEPDYSAIPANQFDWMHTVYGSPEEEVPKDIPMPLGKRVVITHYVDANLYHDKLTGRSVTGILDFVNKTPIDWYSKKQATVETATYGSEFVASRTCVERSIDLRTLLRYLGVPISKTAYMFGDNESVVNSSSTPHAKLHKRHSALSFHRVREAIAAKIIRYRHVMSETNPADILSKHWSHNQAWPLIQCLLFWHGDTIDLYKEGTQRTSDGKHTDATFRQHGE